MGILRTDVISHSQISNGNASVLFDGTADRLTIPSHNAFAFRTADWTVEGWFYFTSITGQQTLVGDTYGNTAGWYLYKQSNHRLGVYYSSIVVDGKTTIEADRWYHFAFVRNSGITRIYINGELDAEGVDTTDATITQYYIADTAQSSGEFFGNISNLRITRTAVYKDNFTVPKFKLKEIPGTILLCCQSSSSTTEATVSVPGTLTTGGDPTATAFGPGLKEDISGSQLITGQDGGAGVGVVFDGVTTFDSQAYMVPSGGITRDRHVKSTGDIVSGNLIFHLDGGDSKSYAGVTTSGSIIYDLKEGTNSTGVGIATMTTGHTDFERVTWVPDNRGCFRQSSDSDFGTITGNMINFPQISLGNDNYTINVWVKLNSIPQGGDEQQIVISNKDGGPVSFLGYLKNVSHRLYIAAGAYYSSWSYKYSTTTAMNIGQWYLLTWVNTAQYTGSMYVDGVLQTLDDGNTTWNSRSSNNTPLNSTSYAGSETFDGWIGQIQFYSDTLSATEILQNYNAHKCRYIY